MNYEEWSSIDFSLLPESLDPSSLTLAFLSQPLYSSQAPPTCVSFFFVFHNDFIGRKILKQVFVMADTFSDDLSFFFFFYSADSDFFNFIFFNFRENLLCGLICYTT